MKNNFDMTDFLTSLRECRETMEELLCALRSVEIEEIPALLAPEEDPRVRSFGVRAVHYFLLDRGIRMGDDVERLKGLGIPGLLEAILKEAGLSPRVTFFAKGLLVVLRQEGWRKLLEELLDSAQELRDSAKEESEARDVARLVLESIIRT